MNNDSRVDLLRGIIRQERELKEKKKAINEDIKAADLEIREQIVDGDGDDKAFQTMKKIYGKALAKTKDRKELNAKLKRLGGAMEKIIMGEDEYDDCQMTIEDILAGKGDGVEVDEPEDDEGAEILPYETSGEKASNGE